jgi:hypothetical protein
VVPW